MVEAQATLDIKFVDVKSARKKLKENAGKVAQEEDDKLEDQGLTLTSSFGTLAARRGVGVGLYFKILPWFGWMMVFMMFCAVPYLITINTSVFTDEAHKYDHTFGVKVFDTFELASFTFAAIVDNAKDAGLLQYMNTLIAGTWDGPMEKRTFLIWISVVDAFAIIALTAATGWLWYEVWKWLAKVDDRTREVADYSIIVGGLPPTVTATEIGDYFQKHFGATKKDKVMDVVLVKNLAFVLAACKKVHRIEGLTSFLIDLKDKEGRQHQLEQNALAAGAQKVLSTARGAMGAAADAAGKAVNAAANAATTAATTVATTAAAAAAAAAAKTAAIIDMGSTAGAAAAAADVEAAKETHGAPGAATSFSPAMQRKMNKAESRIQVQRNKIHEFIDSGKMTTQAAFVTFNTENMRIDACNALPSGWWSAWFTPKQFLFEHAGQKWRLWVQRAASPDDYKYENMSTRIRNNYLIQCCTGAIMFGLILLCAAMITLLNTHASKSARDFKWDVPSMVKPLSKFNATTYNAYYNQFLRPKPSSGSGRRHLQAAARLYADSDNVDYYYMCRNSWVYDTCSAAVNNNTNLGLGNVQFNMRFMKEWTFGKWNSTNATELAESKLARLLFERPVRRYLSTCADNPTAPECYRANHTWVDVSGCLPCYCYALSEIDATKQGPGFIAHVKDTCKQYWAPFDLQRDGVKVAISFVIAIINSILSVVLRMLKVYVERHWTVTATERSLAIWTYVVKVVNSIVVLLVVNCSTLSELQNDAMESEVNGSNGWLSNLALSGLFDDFSPGWYQNVGFSIMILMMINVTSPFVRSISERITKLILQLQVMFLHCGRLHTPEQFNNAWRTPAFTLEQRSSDILFNLTLALLFGSGMPLCYLICAVYLLVLYWWDRANIAHFRQPSQRYSAALPRLMLFFFPVLIVLHCAFGIWMHTFFDPDVDPEVVMQAMVASNQDPTGINRMSAQSVAQRISQPNGVALLVWFAITTLWFAFGRWVVASIIWLAERGCGAVAEALKRLSAKADAAFIPPDENDDGSRITYQQALAAVDPAMRLYGAPTYRMHHIHGYKEYLSDEAGMLWLKAQGTERYTRLTTFTALVEVGVNENESCHSDDSDAEVNGWQISDLQFDVSPDVIRAFTADGKEARYRPSQPSASLQAALLQQVAALEERGIRIKDLALQPSQVTSAHGPGAAQEFAIIHDGQLTAEAAAVKAAPQIGGPSSAANDTPRTVRYSAGGSNSDSGTGNSEPREGGSPTGAPGAQAMVAVQAEDVKVDVK